MRNSKTCVGLKVVTTTGEFEALDLEGAKSSLLTGSVSLKRNKRFIVKINKKTSPFFIRFLFLSLLQNASIGFQLLGVPNTEYNKLDQIKTTQSLLQFVFTRRLQGIEDVWVEMNFQKCQKVNEVLKSSSHLLLTGTVQYGVDERKVYVLKTQVE